MFTNHFTPFTIDSYVLQNWKSFTEFFDYLPSQGLLQFEGVGQLQLVYPLDDTHSRTYKEEHHHLFKLNGKLYSSCVREQENEFKKKERIFAGIFELKTGLLTSADFNKLACYNTTNYFQEFEVALDVDCKHYNYNDQEKLLISKHNKIDLYYSQELSTFATVAGCQLQSKLSPAVEPAIKWQKMMNILNVRCEQVLAEKQAKAKKV